MGLFDKVNKFINQEAGDNEEQMQDSMQDQDFGQAYETQTNEDKSFSFPNPMQSNMDNVVSFGSARTPVMLKKVINFEDTQPVADALNEKRIVIINLENCEKNDAVRVIDFLSGVAYANGGGLKSIATKAYIITPERVPLTGDFAIDDNSENMNGFSIQD